MSDYRVYKDIVELREDVSDSPLYGEDLAPVPSEGRTWNMWHLAAIWVGMAVCIPTYMLAADMIKSGIDWWIALIIIGAANLIITVPMVLNGHAGVKYGVPFPVLGRAAFGTNGIHLPAIVRAIVACGWFGIQTWIGGLAIYAIWCVLVGVTPALGLTSAKFVSFGVFWLINMYFVWNGTESIKWLEQWAAPILLIIGVLLIVWSTYRAGDFALVLEQRKQLEKPTGELKKSTSGQYVLKLNPLKTKKGKIKATEYKVELPTISGRYYDLGWKSIDPKNLSIAIPTTLKDTLVMIDSGGLFYGKQVLKLSYRTIDNKRISGLSAKTDKRYITSTAAEIKMSKPTSTAEDVKNKLWSYLLMLTAMVGFWATMSLSIADITRYASTQKAQLMGQFIGLPTTMILFSFVGIFVTCAAVINFPDILSSHDAPWDPVTLLGKFENPLVVVIAQIFMLIATLSTNIAANVIAPSNAFANLLPRYISFRTGGLITGVIGILICPWWLINDIIGILVFVSGLLGPVLGILLADYYVIRNRRLNLEHLYKPKGIYAYGGWGFNWAAMVALVIGVALAIVGYWVEPLNFLYKLSWFTGFFVSFAIYYVLMKRKHIPNPADDEEMW